MKKVGEGSYGVVHCAKDFYHGMVAIKRLNVQNPNQEQIIEFKNEVSILKTSRHENILMFIGCILEPFLAIVTEWCPGSSLYRHLHVQEEFMEMHQILDIAKQIGIGMEYLHARDILHRDLKSNNIFLIPKENKIVDVNNNMLFFNSNIVNNEFLNVHNNVWKVKIGDFGLATVKTSWNLKSLSKPKPTGSILWMAPEVITQRVEHPYSTKSDVYSFGAVLYELVTGNLPFSEREQNMVH
jgi:B-Raf proto-oncogene serine/threonine-protein kinase